MGFCRRGDGGARVQQERVHRGHDLRGTAVADDRHGSVTLVER